MTGLEVVGDITGMWQESVQNVSTGLAGLGTEELANSTQAFADALDVLAGTAQVVSVAASLLAMRNARETAEVAAEVAVKAANPLTWPLVAAGLAAAAMTSAFVYSYTRDYTIQADLGTASGSLAMATTVGAVI